MNDIDFNIDYYKVLGVDGNSSNKIIKKAYHRLAKESHPDVSGSKDDTKFKKVSNAYSILGNEDKRKIYDNARKRRGGDQTFSFGNGMFQNIFKSAFTSDNIGGNMFQNVFTPPQKETKLKPLRVMLSVTLEDIFNCSIKNVKITKTIPCSTCDGNKIDMDKYSKSDKNYGCSRCIGRGVVNMVQTSQHTRISIPMTCPQCNGERILIRPEIQCDRCSGRGKKNVAETISYKLSHNIIHKSLITIRQRGNQNQPQEIPGDIQIIINQTNHPKFRRSKNGKNLLMIEKISLYFSLGCCSSRSITIRTISKDLLKINIADGIIIKPGSVLKIPGNGIGGHLYIIFEVVFPDAISEDNLSLLKQALDFSQPNKKEGEQNESENSKYNKLNLQIEELNYDHLESVKISEIYSSFPINKKIRLGEYKDDEDSPETSNCPIM